jgi:hypothetical protein
MAFSIKQLLFCVAVLAFGLVAMLSEDNAVLGHLFDLLTLGVLIGMAYGAWLSAGETRAFRVGFLCWSLLYFFLFKKIFDVGIADLISGGYLDLIVHAFTTGGIPQGMKIPEPPVFSQRGVGAYLYPNFHLVFHSLLLLLLGIIGGWVTMFFYRKRQRILDQHI